MRRSGGWATRSAFHSAFRCIESDRYSHDQDGDTARNEEDDLRAEAIGARDGRSGLAARGPDTVRGRRKRWAAMAASRSRFAVSGMDARHGGLGARQACDHARQNSSAVIEKPKAEISSRTTGTGRRRATCAPR
ncbi:hypothetical protein MAFF241647_47870 (plasmid) [Ralstonia solanacearum]|nr:hypothetical protein MAFF241647_47870 [Ralstonia solanacearum]